MGSLSQEYPFYAFALVGYSPRLRQILENHPKVKPYQGLRDDCDYTFETETGVAYLQVGIVLGTTERATLVKEGILPEVNEREWLNSTQYYKDGIYFELSINTSSGFIEELITFFDELTKEFPFVIKVLSTEYTHHRSVEKTSPLYPMVAHPKLRDEYQEAHKHWKIRQRAIEGTGMVAFFLDDDPIVGKHPDDLGAPLVYYFKAGMYGYLPICIFLSPKTIAINVASEDNYLQFKLEGNPVSLDPEQGFYQKIETFQLEQCQILQVDRQKNMVILGKENFRIPLKLIVTEIDGGYQYATVTTLAKVTKTPPQEIVEYHQRILDITAHTQAEGEAKEILQCLIELATKLEWHIVEGLEFEKTAPADLNVQALISLSESILRSKSNL